MTEPNAGTGELEKGQARPAKASAELEAKRQKMLPKAKATGAAADQIQAEWLLWLSEIEEKQK